MVESSGWVVVLSSGAVCDVAASDAGAGAGAEAARETQSASSRIKRPLKI